LPPPAPIVRYARYGAVAFEFSGTIGAGAIVGWLLDRWLGTEPYLLIVSTLSAVVGGFIRLIQVLRRFDRLDLDNRQP
jgi:F0F1-type ATP synthase assembly protein I